MKSNLSLHNKSFESNVHISRRKTGYSLQMDVVHVTDVMGCLTHSPRIELLLYLESQHFFGFPIKLYKWLVAIALA